VAAASGAAIDTTVLRSELEQRLPDYMVPSAIVVLDRLPLTPNGKVDRRALPAPELMPGHGQHHGQRHALRSQQDVPLTSAETSLLAIWRKALNVPTLSANDDFFAAGGNSLQAIRVIAIAERELGMIIPLRTWIEGRTVRRITSLLEHAELSVLPKGIVRIRRGDKGYPLYCLPGAAGGALQFERFATKLRTGRAIYAVEPHNFDIKHSTLGSLVDTAAAAVRCIREVQPKGPYSIIGFSYGGNLAIEVARTLLHEGERIALLAALDTHAPGARRKLRGIRKFPRLLKILRRMRFHEACGYLTSRTLRQLGLITPKPASQIFQSDHERISAKVYQLESDAVASYHPGPIDQRMLLVQAIAPEENVDRSWTEVADPSDPYGWAPICTGGIDVIRIDCKHLELFQEPHITKLAHHLGDFVR
jgi:thioesterase domain-containing protein